MEGAGSISGRVLADGHPVADAEVTCLFPSGHLQIQTGEDGRFGLVDVPAGRREILVRATGIERAWRGEALVAKKKVSELGDIALVPAGHLEVRVRDGSGPADLDLEEAAVLVRELPTLSAVTDFGGRARLGPLPRLGCYHVEIAREPFRFETEKICPSETEWEGVFTLAPSSNAEIPFHQIHHAIARIEKIARAGDCQMHPCQVPAFWAGYRSAPCAVPVCMDTEAVKVLQKHIIDVRSSMRFSASPWNTLVCPETLPDVEHQNGLCVFKDDPGVAISVIARGRCNPNCPAEQSMMIPDREHLDALLRSFGATKERYEKTTEKLLFFKTRTSDEPPTPVFFFRHEHGGVLFFDGVIDGYDANAPSRNAEYSWAVVGIDGGSTELSENIQGQQAWIHTK